MAVHEYMRSCARRRVRCSKQRVARLMREMELAAKRRRHKPVGTTRTRGAPVAPNLLNREFEAQAPNRKWVSDTTYVWTAEGWLYVAVILDLFSRRARRLGDEPAQRWAAGSPGVGDGGFPSLSARRDAGALRGGAARIPAQAICIA